jgi:hypothetical protein
VEFYGMDDLAQYVLDRQNTWLKSTIDVLQPAQPPTGPNALQVMADFAAVNAAVAAHERRVQDLFEQVFCPTFTTSTDNYQSTCNREYLRRQNAIRKPAVVQTAQFEAADALAVYQALKQLGKDAGFNDDLKHGIDAQLAKWQGYYYESIGR